MQTVLGRHSCGLYQARIGAGGTGSELVLAAPGQNQYGLHRAKIGADSTRPELVRAAPGPELV